MMTCVTYLGYCVSENGISPCNEHIEVVSKYSIPRNVKELHSFVGLISYFRRFVPNFLVTAKPLCDVLKKSTEFSCAEKTLMAFENLKSRSVSAPVLAIYSPSCRNRTTLRRILSRF